MLVLPQTFTQVVELYDKSLYLRAYQTALEIAPLEEWEGTTARILAGRLAATLGAPKLGRRHQLLAYRHDPKDWEARYYYARMILHYRGALDAWNFLQKHDTDHTLITSDPKFHSDWLAFHAVVLAHLRDFERAEPWLARAEKVAPSNVWVWVERARVFELQDRYEDTLSVLRYALRLQPWFRPTIATAARILVLQEQDDEALRLLEQAAQHVECAWLVEQLAHLQIELGQFTEARQSLERMAALSPMMEPEVLEQLNAHRADAAYLSGDLAAARAYAQRGQSPALQKFAQQLQNITASDQRVVLPVSFIRQHHLTCAPATLAMLSRYYQMPADHLEVAEEICYDGTSAYNERKWALNNGYAAREFRVTWESAVELLDRQIAFTLGTIDPGGGHLQAVIGYDKVRQTLIVRDPAERHYNEIEAQALLQQYRSCGPRGMALAPVKYSALLNSLDLPEAEIYDQLYALQEALENHDRTTARTIYQSMTQRFGLHRLTMQAKLALAAYDDDYPLLLACYEKLLEMFPPDVNFQLNKAMCLRALAKRNQELEYLDKVCAPAEADPLLWLEYARVLSEDARQLPQARWWLRRALRKSLPNANGLHLLADVLWQQKPSEEALELYRLAACLNDKDEQLALAYFRAAQQLNRADVALEFLHNRFRLLGEHSAAPVQTLFHALELSGKKKEAFAALQAGLEKGPQDGQLKLYAAEVFARYGNYAGATALLKEAQPRTSASEWLRVAATIASYRGQWNEALLHWLQVAESEPLALDANQKIAQLLATTESPQAALEFLRDHVARYPHSIRLRELLVEFLLGDPVEAEAELQRLLPDEAVNEWVHRTLALVLLVLHRLEEALAMATTACQLNLSSPENHSVRGQILFKLGRLPEAREAFCAAINLSAEHAPAIAGLVAASVTPAEKREALLIVRQELTRQLVSGESLLLFANLAKDILTPDELLEQLREAVRQRPEKPHTWSALISHLLALRQVGEALTLARQATERFPSCARSWRDLAQVHEVRAEQQEQILALQRALTINPDGATTRQRLAQAYEQLGQLGQACALIEQGISLAPLDHELHGALAALLWQTGAPEKALAALQHALLLEPDYDRGWQALNDWARQSNNPALVQEQAHELTVQRPGDPRSWLALARAFRGKDAITEQLAALDRAIALAPRLVEAHHLRARILMEAGRYDEALLACRPAALRPPPIELSSTEASLLAQYGNLSAAIKLTCQVLQQEPSYAPAWERLACWYRTLEKAEEYLDAAQQFVRLLPGSFMAQGYLGEARLWNGDRAGAKEAFQQAVALAPDYDFAALSLFDLQLEDKDLAAAREVLTILEQFNKGDATTLRALKLAALYDDHVQTQEHLLALCVSPHQRATYLDEAVAMLAQTKIKNVVAIVLEEALALPNVNPYVGRHWVHSCLEKNKLSHCLDRLSRLAESGASPLWHKAAAALLEFLAQTGAAEQANSFIQKYNDLLRQDGETWGATGLALYELGNAEAAVEWMSDWQQRYDVAPWMLWNLVLALRDLNRESEAQAVSQLAINLPDDERTNSHLALLSLDEALAGRIEKAEQHAARITAQALNERDQFVVALLTGLREFQQALGEGRQQSAPVIEQLLSLAQQSAWLKKSKTFVELFKRVIDHVLTADGDSFLKLKTKLKMHWL